MPVPTFHTIPRGILAGGPSDAIPGMQPLYWFSADQGVHADQMGLLNPALNGEAVARWDNRGTGGNALQSDLLRRPTYRTGGLNGKPYIECVRANQQWFEDLPFAQQSVQVFDVNIFTVIVVTDQTDTAGGNIAIVGSPNGQGFTGRNTFYLRSQADLGIHIYAQNYRKRTNLSTPQIIGCRTTERSNPSAGELGPTIMAYPQMRIRQNDTVLDYLPSSENMNATTLTHMQFLRAFQNANAGIDNLWFHGRIYEFIMWSGHPSLANFNIVYTNLRAKYAI